MKLAEQISKAVNVLQHGGVIAYPTEAVFGLGCDPDNTGAVQRLLDYKQRPADKGLILVSSSFGQLEKYLQPLEAGVQQRVFATWPGPYTWLWPAKENVSRLLRGRHATLAVRVSAHPVVRALCDAFGGAIVSTSANPANRPPARNVAEVRTYFNDKLDYIIDAELGAHAQPTEIRDVLTNKVIRPGQFGGDS